MKQREKKNRSTLMPMGRRRLSSLFNSSLILLVLLVAPNASLANVASLSSSATLEGEQPRIAEIDRVRLAEAFRIGKTLGNKIWPGWDKAPFAVLLITTDHEFLIRHPKPPSDFTAIGDDSLLHSRVFYRKRTMPPNWLATFPIAGVPTIVVGQAENTAKKTSTPWVVTVLHEHFHQLQNSQPRYYEDVNALGLTRGDQTGMWMLNYPFPYDWMEMEEHFSLLTLLLADALEAKTRSDSSAKLAAYREQRRELEKTLSPDDYRYFSFQLWQEGIARYTEYRVAKLAAEKYKPSAAFRALGDYKTFADVAEETKSGILNELRISQLEDSKRVMFYAIGAGEGLLLDRAKPGWQRRYFVDKFYLDKYFER